MNGLFLMLTYFCFCKNYEYKISFQNKGSIRENVNIIERSNDSFKLKFQIKGTCDKFELSNCNLDPMNEDTVKISFNAEKFEKNGDECNFTCIYKIANAENCDNVKIINENADQKPLIMECKDPVDNGNNEEEPKQNTTTLNEPHNDSTNEEGNKGKLGEGGGGNVANRKII